MLAPAMYPPAIHINHHRHTEVHIHATGAPHDPAEPRQQRHTQHIPNGHDPAVMPPPAPSSRPPPPRQQEKEPVVVEAIPSMTVSGDEVIIGNANSSSTRSYTPLKVLGDGSFGTVWLCDWHSDVPPGTQLSPMQCGRPRPEWAGKRLVAVKRMKKKWEGGWEECKHLKELESLRSIPRHPNIIPLYDSFLLPSTKELYFVFESMEGNLYQLIRSRKGRPLAGGLVSSIFLQVVSGLSHIHDSGYFHRDMKPENLLVTTTGLQDYRSTSPLAAPNASPERDVSVIVKLADFGLARETASRPPYTEYVSTRWYRAPEVLLRSREYSNPVDMWALGTILAELINLKPLFPGQGEVDQVLQICQILGDPSDEYGYDDRGRARGGGKWSKGIKLARNVGFTFPKSHPKPFFSLFDPSVPPSLVRCIGDLLKYDPDTRLTARQCLDHDYLIETTPRPPPTATLQIHTGSPVSSRSSRIGSIPNIPPRSVPPSHSQSPVQRPAFNSSIPPVPPLPPLEPSSSHRTPFYAQPASQSRSYEFPHEGRPSADLASYGHRPPPSPVPSSVFTVGADRISSTWARQHPSSDRYQPMDVTYHNPDQHDHVNGAHDPPTPAVNGAPAPKTGVLGSLKKPKWGFGSVFGGEKAQPNTLPPVDEMNYTSSTPSLKRTQSNSTADSRSLPEISPMDTAPPPIILDPKKQKKLLAKLELEEKMAERRELERRNRERARAVQAKRRQITDERGKVDDFESTLGNLMGGSSATRRDKGKKPMSYRGTTAGATSSSQPQAPSRRFVPESTSGNHLLAAPVPEQDMHRSLAEHRSKTRRIGADDDFSISSDAQSVSHVSMISFATVDSDPGPMRHSRHRTSPYGINRTTSVSSLRSSSARGFSPSARSSNSLGDQFIADFTERTTFSPPTTISEVGSPPPMQALSLSPVQQPQWPVNDPSNADSSGMSSWSARRADYPNAITLPPLGPVQPSGKLSPFDFSAVSSHPPSPVPPSAINPIFQVPPFQPSSPSNVPNHLPLNSHSLPPFSHLESVAEQLQAPTPLHSHSEPLR